MADNSGTLYDFMFDSKYELSDQLWFIDALSGETRTRANVKNRTDSLALGLQACLSQELNSDTVSSNIKDELPYTVGPVVSLISTNNVDYGACVWASHKLGYTVAPSNAGSTVDELTHQLRISGAMAVIVHPKALVKVLEAACVVGISAERIFVLAQGRAENLDEQIKG